MSLHARPTELATMPPSNGQLGRVGVGGRTGIPRGAGDGFMLALAGDQIGFNRGGVLVEKEMHAEKMQIET